MTSTQPSVSPAPAATAVRRKKKVENATVDSTISDKSSPSSIKDVGNKTVPLDSTCTLKIAAKTFIKDTTPYRVNVTMTARARTCDVTMDTASPSSSCNMDVPLTSNDVQSLYNDGMSCNITVYRNSTKTTTAAPAASKPKKGSGSSSGSAAVTVKEDEVLEHSTDSILDCDAVIDCRPWFSSDIYRTLWFVVHFSQSSPSSTPIEYPDALYPMVTGPGATDTSSLCSGVSLDDIAVQYACASMSIPGMSHVVVTVTLPDSTPRSLGADRNYMTLSLYSVGSLPPPPKFLVNPAPSLHSYFSVIKCVGVEKLIPPSPNKSWYNNEPLTVSRYESPLVMALDDPRSVMRGTVSVDVFDRTRTRWSLPLCEIKKHEKTAEKSAKPKKKVAETPPTLSMPENAALLSVTQTSTKKSGAKSESGRPSPSPSPSPSPNPDSNAPSGTTKTSSLKHTKKSTSGEESRTKKKVELLEVPNIIGTTESVLSPSPSPSVADVNTANISQTEITVERNYRSDPYGESHLALNQVLEMCQSGKKNDKFVLLVSPSRQRGTPQDIETPSPGTYSESYIKLYVSVSDPSVISSKCNEQTEPGRYCRCVMMLSHGQPVDSWVIDILCSVSKANAAALGIKAPPITRHDDSIHSIFRTMRTEREALDERVVDSMLAAMVLSETQKNDETLDIVSGFNIVDDDRRIIVLEGLADGQMGKLMASAVAGLEVLKAEADTLRDLEVVRATRVKTQPNNALFSARSTNSSTLRGSKSKQPKSSQLDPPSDPDSQSPTKNSVILFNPKIRFDKRLYPGWVDVKSFLLIPQLSVITSQHQEIFLGNAVPRSCLDALHSLKGLLLCNKLMDVRSRNLFLSDDNVISLYKKYGNDIPRDYVKETKKSVVNLPQTQPGTNQAQGQAQGAPLQIIKSDADQTLPKSSSKSDVKRVPNPGKFDRYAYRESPKKKIDFIAANIKEFPSEPDIDNPRQRQVSENECQEVYLYGGQTNNHWLSEKRRLKDQMDATGDILDLDLSEEHSRTIQIQEKKYNESLRVGPEWSMKRHVSALVDNEPQHELSLHAGDAWKEPNDSKGRRKAHEIFQQREIDRLEIRKQARQTNV